MVESQMLDATCAFVRPSFLAHFVKVCVFDGCLLVRAPLSDFVLSQCVGCLARTMGSLHHHVENAYALRVLRASSALER
jgi:hypothetical protein